MARSPSELPHNFPDRAMREALVQPDNLHALMRAVAPQVADHFDYPRLEIVGKPYFLDDWRSRERDVLVRLPYRDETGQRELLVCILVEHQSEADPVMPLRMLVYAVFFWEQEWRRWEEGHPHGEPFRLTPVLPVVLHTGPRVWDAHRSLAELFVVPSELQAWLPAWPMPLWDLQEHPAEELLHKEDAFWQMLAVVRAERAPTDEFLATLRAALSHLEPLGTSARVRWDQLLRMALHWALFRRPPGERQRVRVTAADSHASVELKREIEKMNVQIEKTYEEELIEKFLREGEARGEAKGKALGKAEGEAAANRAALRMFLEQRFQVPGQPLPEDVLQCIAAADPDKVKAALASVLTIGSLAELAL
jgi:Putative transposase, YhgA-like